MSSYSLIVIMLTGHANVLNDLVIILKGHIIGLKRPCRRAYWTCHHACHVIVLFGHVIMINGHCIMFKGHVTGLKGHVIAIKELSSYKVSVSRGHHTQRSS